MPFCSFLKMYDVLAVEWFLVDLLSIGRGWMTKGEKRKASAYHLLSMV